MVTHNGNMNWGFLLNCAVMFWSAKGFVLDPSLYLSPSPPLTASRDLVNRWSSRETRVERNVEDSKGPTTAAAESMESAETIWPMTSITNYGLRSIHIPLTFSISGTYGNYGPSAGLVGSSYASVSADGSDSSYGGNQFSTDAGNIFSAYGKMSLAGSSYGSYGSGYPGTRIYGGASGPSWSGWGNGKWGHYGKG